MHSTNLLTYLLTYLDEQFLQFSGLGFVTLGPFHCAYIHFYLCVCIVFFHTAYLSYYCTRCMRGPRGIKA